MKISHRIVLIIFLAAIVLMSGYCYTAHILKQHQIDKIDNIKIKEVI